MRTICSSILLFIVTISFTQHYTEFTHYSVDDGLSENHVLCMIQDKKGIMWFGTYSGLDRYDGVSFRNYKGNKKTGSQLLNFRINKLIEDDKGYLWIQTYDKNIYRFDSSHEEFLRIPQSINEFQNFKGGFNKIKKLTDGSLWLYDSDSKNGDCFRIQYKQDNHSLKATYYSNKNKDLLSNKVFLIYADETKKTWILTSKGINYIDAKSNKTQILQFTNNKKAFYSIHQMNGSIYFGGEKGTLIRYINQTDSITIVDFNIKENIIDLQKVSESEILILTDEFDFYLYNVLDLTIEKYKSQHRLFGCYMDKEKRVWLNTDFNGAIYFDYISKKLNYLPIDDEWYSNFVSQRFYVIEDAENNLWVQVRNGGFYQFNDELNALEHIIIDDLKSEDISNTVNAALIDKQGILWLRTYHQGINKLVYHHSPFHITKPSPFNTNDLTNEVRTVFQDSKKNLWIGTKEGYLFVYSSKKELIGELCEDGKIGFKNPVNMAVYCILEDHHHNLWIGTKGLGVFKLTPSGKTKFQITHYQNKPDDSFSLSSNDVYSIFQDHLNRIWIGTFSGGINIVTEKNDVTQFINHNNILEGYPVSTGLKSRFITEDHNQNILIGTTEGIIVCKPDKNDYRNIEFVSYSYQPKNKYSLSGNDVIYILPTLKGEIYVALSGGGINKILGDIKNIHNVRFEKVDKFPSDIINSIIEDSLGNMWMSSQTRILKYIVANGEFEIYKPKGKGRYFFSESAATQTINGEIVFGTSNGFLSFNPYQITKSAYSPNVVLNQLYLNNIVVDIHSNNSPISKTLDDVNEVTLNHDQSVVSISYAAIDFTDPNAVEYAYYIEGLEDDWNYVGDQKIARYINLPKGEYIFHVKSTNTDGVWANNTRSLKIKKLPSFWESKWGVALYAIIFILLSVLISYIIFIIYKLRNEVKVEQKISDMKLKFFTDISHELRTPLTLIISPVNNILKSEVLSEKGLAQLKMVQKNTNRLLRLVNQILDFRKIQKSKLKLRIELVLVKDFLDDICLSFTDIASENNISIEVIDKSDNSQLWIDKDKFEKIFFNLISNAIKYSQTGQKVIVNIKSIDDSIEIDVIDKGLGISDEKLKALFNRFESTIATQQIFQPGIGIGLSLTKELIELHKGTIEVESQYSKGTTFKVRLKKGYKHHGENVEIIQKSTTPLSLVGNDSNQNSNDEISNNNAEEHGSVKIILVEDNTELRSFIKSTLPGKYDIREANNGQEALNIATSFSPDVILSDLMMPDMDGIELCRILKNNIDTSHIPFILLTSRTDIESKLKALELGVNDYITKPFDIEYLQARIENLLKIRLQLKSYFRSSVNSGVITLSQPNISTLDQEFITKVTEFLEKNYSDSELNIDIIAESVNVSRSTFYKKIKSLTGISPVNFMKEFRLQKAVLFFKSGANNVGQVAFKVGINDPRYFSRCFKEKYGMIPSKYLKKLSEE